MDYTPVAGVVSYVNKYKEKLNPHNNVKKVSFHVF